MSDEELVTLFRSIDTDGSGALTMPEVVLFLKSITDDISEDNIEKIFAALDDSGDKAVDFQEFKTVMCSLADSGWSRCKKDKESVTEAEVKHLFDMIDRDKSGALTMREARKACKLIKDRFGIEEVEEWLNACDRDRDGEVSFEEFKFSLMGNLMVDL